MRNLYKLKELKIVVFLLSLFTAMLPLWAGELSAVPEAFYMEGVKLSKTDPEQAYRKFSEAIKEGNPAWNHLSDCFFQRGVLLFNKEDIQGALQDFSLSVEGDKKKFAAVLYMAKCYFMLQKNQECLQTLQLAEELDPKNAEVHYIWARMMMTEVEGSGKMLEANMVTAAVDQFDQAIDLNKKYTEAYYYRGLAQAAVGATKKAYKDLQQTVKINPKLYKAWYELARVYIEAKMPEKALEALQTCLEIREYKPGYQLILSVTQDLHADDTLEQYLEKALVAFPNDPDFKKLREIYKEVSKKQIPLKGKEGENEKGAKNAPPKKPEFPVKGNSINNPQLTNVKPLSPGPQKETPQINSETKGVSKKASLDFPEENWY